MYLWISDKLVCGSVCVCVCVLHVHNAGSADPSLHRLLACTVLLSSLISSVNVSLWLIENELVYASLQCFYKDVKEIHTLSSAGQTSDGFYCMQKNSLLLVNKSINSLVQRHSTRWSCGTIISCQEGTADKSGICGDKTTYKASAERVSPVAVIYSKLS